MFPVSETNKQKLILKRELNNQPLRKCHDFSYSNLTISTLHEQCGQSENAGYYHRFSTVE
ncbi:hypothetical protein T11_11251 [Trichinella zimbabwensis]|uniref:Uncharacterized protein n=1 Tax=Trichinella zimbabwensis TaxID=268475 RepID=A0A0V1HU66_9BILA|nr:hypothetical protein T11_11251 [Trichinella zimbabwensis]